MGDFEARFHSVGLLADGPPTPDRIRIDLWDKWIQEGLKFDFHCLQTAGDGVLFRNIMFTKLHHLCLGPKSSLAGDEV